MNSILYLKKYILRYKAVVLGAAFCVIAANWFNLLIPQYVGQAVDYIRSGEAEGSALIRFGLIILAFGIGQALFLFLMRIFMYRTARHIEYDFRNDLYLKFQSLHPGFYDKQKIGDLMARSTNDMEAVRMLLGPGLLFAMFSLVIFPLAIYRMFKVNVPLTCYSIIPLIIMPLYVNRVGNQIHKRFRKVQDQYSAITAMVQENLAGIRVIKAFRQEKSQTKTFHHENEDFIKKNLALVKIRAGFFPGMRLLGGCGILILIWLGGHWVIQKRLTLGDLTALTMIHMRLFWPMIALGWIISLHQRGAASMKRLLEIINVTPEVRDTDKTDHSIDSVTGEISIRNIRYRYESEDEDALRDISLKIPAASTLGIVGPIGCGKSTLIRLITRIYEPPPGTIFIDGRDILEFPLEVLRRHIGYVFQTPFLFSDTIHDNIVFSAPDATREDVIRVAKAVNIHDEIMSLPDGYNTPLGERGVNLSGGQKQRIALARALIRNPEILILDDTLSAVDTETESKILSMLRKEMKRRTSIVISHRISSVMTADQIIFMEKGRIVEKGTHEELLSHGGRYADIYEKQRLEDELARED